MNHLTNEEREAILREENKVMDQARKKYKKIKQKNMAAIIFCSISTFVYLSGIIGRFGLILFVISLFVWRHTSSAKKEGEREFFHTRKKYERMLCPNALTIGTTDEMEQEMQDAVEGLDYAIAATQLCDSHDPFSF